MMKKKENNKQTLFENMMKINPDLKNNVRINNMLNENVIMNNGGLQEVEDYNTNSVDGAMGFAQSHAERETPDGAYDDDVEIEPEDEEGDRKWAEEHNKMMKGFGVETWKKDIDPSNHEQFIKQAKGLGMRAQELYDEMKAEKDAVNPQSINEGELSREDMMSALKSKFGLSHVDTTENFYQDSGEGEGGIWLSGENGDLASDGTELFDYYSTDYKNREFGIHNEFNKFCEDNGWYPEWNDPGTLMVWSNSMEENKGLTEENGEEVQGPESIDTGKKFVVVGNQNYRGWAKKKGYMKTITTPTHDNSEYVLSDEVSAQEAKEILNSIQSDEQWKNSGLVAYTVAADEIDDKPRPTRKRDPDEWMDYINEARKFLKG